METEKMIALPEAVVGEMEAWPGPIRGPTITAAGELAGARAPSRPDPAVSEKAWRRRFGVDYKARILRQADQATAPGHLDALLRRAGLSSSNHAAWRKLRDSASLGALAQKRRGRKADPQSPLFEETKSLRRGTGTRLRKHCRRMRFSTVTDAGPGPEDDPGDRNVRQKIARARHDRGREAGRFRGHRGTDIHPVSSNSSGP